ncbi:hypothetical protein ARMGADRAFT_1029989 [Armillaria gallica]|uniref:Uncharacterized protein n=1 Tax=Armillaria gallica TaxID=47427 RepID=A0A2H3DG21_ARMGA|nr:hypothetical protein ARMGADRAFT_1029989 [Armillaria gallica]
MASLPPSSRAPSLDHRVFPPTTPHILTLPLYSFCATAPAIFSGIVREYDLMIIVVWFYDGNDHVQTRSSFTDMLICSHQISDSESIGTPISGTSARTLIERHPASKLSPQDSLSEIHAGLWPTDNDDRVEKLAYLNLALFYAVPGQLLQTIIEPALWASKLCGIKHD